MEAQQMMELLVARFNASMKEHVQEMKAEMKANQAKAKANQEDLLAKMEAKMDSNLVKVDSKLEEMLARMGEDIKSGQAEMRSTACAIRSELEAIQHEIRAVIQPIQSELDETTACNEATETEPDPGMMQSVAEHQEAPKGEATVMPVREPRRQRRVHNLAAERSQKRKERTRGVCGSRSKLAAACRKVSCHATVAWRRKNAVRKMVDRARNLLPPE
jgi:hypothetical protein